MFTLPTIYDTDLMQSSHYQNFPQMLPFVGSHYANTKLLLVGESHYLPEVSKIQLNVEEWYKSNVQMLNINETIWTNTRQVVNDYITPGRKPKSYVIFSNPENAIQIHAKNSKFNFQGKKGIEHLAFYNFFQRPAEKLGDSIKCTQLDIQTAEDTLTHIIKAIDPKFIIFTSTKAWNNISLNFKSANPSIKFDFVSHPGCPWWNRVSKQYGGMTAKAKFMKFLDDNKIF